MAVNLVLLLYSKNCNICAQEDSAVTILFYDQVVFCDIHTECDPKAFLVGQCNSCRLALVTCWQ